MTQYFAHYPVEYLLLSHSFFNWALLEKSLPSAIFRLPSFTPLHAFILKMESNLSPKPLKIWLMEAGMFLHFLR